MHMEAQERRALFDGVELAPEDRAKIMENFESLMARSTLAAAEMAMDADVVLVAAAADGETEEKVRASSTVLMRASSGFRGVLEESPGEIKLWRPGAGVRMLHPIAAVRFVMAVVHAVEAHEETPATGLDVGAPPPLDVLLSACQIADCWDCPPVLATAARCLQRAAVAEQSEPRRVVSVLVKMLRLVKPLGESNGLHWMQLRAAVDTALAKCVPIGWLPSVLKTFDLESACRVINEVDDLTVELKPLVLKGPSMLAKAWYDPSGEHQPCLHGEWTRWLDDSVGGRTGVGAGGRRLNGRFRLEVATVKPDESKAQKARELVEQVTSLSGAASGKRRYADSDARRRARAAAGLAEEELALPPHRRWPNRDARCWIMPVDQARRPSPNDHHPLLRRKRRRSDPAHLRLERFGAGGGAGQRQCWRHDRDQQMASAAAGPRGVAAPDQGPTRAGTVPPRGQFGAFARHVARYTCSPPLLRHSDLASRDLLSLL